MSIMRYLTDVRFIGKGVNAYTEEDDDGTQIIDVDAMLTDVISLRKASDYTNTKEDLHEWIDLHWDEIDPHPRQMQAVFIGIALK